MSDDGRKKPTPKPRRDDVKDAPFRESNDDKRPTRKDDPAIMEDVKPPPRPRK